MGEIILNRLSILLVSGVMILAAAYVSGCLKSSEDDGNGKLLEKGNSWTYKVNDVNYGNGEVMVTVVTESKTFEGNEVIEVKIETSYDAFHDEDIGMHYDAWDGSGVSYFRKVDQETVYTEYEWEIKGRRDPADEWNTTRWEGETTYATTGTIPEILEAGTNYTLVETSDDHYKIFVDGSERGDETSENTLTKTYTVLGEKEATVPAGTFTCWELRVEDDMDSLTMKYFCPELNIDVKIVEYYDGEITSTYELKSYST